MAMDATIVQAVISGLIGGLIAGAVGGVAAVATIRVELRWLRRDVDIAHERIKELRGLINGKT